jgi:hypothetical protein
VVGKILENPVILLENIYNMNKTRIILCILGFIKVHINKDDPRDYKGAGIKYIIIITIEYININNRFLLLIIIWLVIIYRSN